MPGTAIIDDQMLALWGHSASLGTLCTASIAIYNRYRFRGLLQGRRTGLSCVARTFAIGASVLAATTGLAFGLFLPSSASAQETPPTTVPTPTLPTPDPAPTPKPKPTPKPAPKPAPRTTPRAYSTPTYQSPRQQSVTPRSTPKPKVRAHPKPKKKVKEAPIKTETTVLPKVSVTPPIGAVGVRNAFQTKSGGGSFDLGSLVIVLGLGLAIACFAVALVPATHVKWRPVAIFVSERQVDLTIIGLALLMGAVFTFLWTKGS